MLLCTVHCLVRTLYTRFLKRILKKIGQTDRHVYPEFHSHSSSIPYFPGGGWGLQKEVLQQMLHSKLVGLSPEKEAQEAAPASPRSSKEKRVRHHTSIDPREVQTATVRALSKSSSSRRARSRSDVDMRDVRLYNASITFPLLLNIYIYIYIYSGGYLAHVCAALPMHPRPRSDGVAAIVLI